MPNQQRRPNCTIIQHGVYEVRTQAGFRKALKHYRDDREDLKVEDVSSWPTEYPSVVTMTIGYQGYWYIQVRAITVARLKGVLQ